MFGEEIIIAGAIGAGFVAVRQRMQDRRLAKTRAAARQARLDEDRRYQRARYQMNNQIREAYRTVTDELYGH